MQTPEISFPRPDDWHVHLRDDGMLRAVLADSARHFARAIVMPNLKPPVTQTREARAYRQRILAALPADSRFEPLLTCYLTDITDTDDLAGGFSDAVFTAAKLYPAGATTNSAAGVSDVRKLDKLFESMARSGMPLLIHGEVVDRAVDIFDREAVFIETVLDPLRKRHPELRIVLEHITTATAVDYVLAADASLLAATITPHHLAVNRNALFDGGLCPHMYCLPVIKRERHRAALCKAACSGDRHFFLGTDSAPHRRQDKESACGCAGIYNSPNALATYLEIFDQAEALPRFAAFASENGAHFYRLPVNRETVTYRRCATPPAVSASGPDDVVVFEPPFALHWQEARA